MGKIFKILVAALLIYSNLVNASVRAITPTPSIELCFVQVARHGLRSPEFPYPNDLYSNESLYWPNGWGQLTQLGKKQQVDLGRFLRKHYSSFLSPAYSTKEVFAISSGYDRTIQSAQLAMYGMFSGANGLMDLNSFIPVHSIPRSIDKMIAPRQQCPYRNELHKETIDSNPGILKIKNDSAELMDYLRGKMGYGPKVVNEVYNSIGSLHIQALHNYSIPSWASDVLSSPEKMDLIIPAFTFSTFTEELKRLTGGPILSELVANMHKKINGTEERKMIYFSGHDILLANMLNTIGAWKPHWPGFSTCLLFELYAQNKSQETNYFLEIKYKEKTDSDVVTSLNIPGCQYPCKLEKFVELMDRYLPSDLEKECNPNSYYRSEECEESISNLNIGLIAAVAALILIIILENLYCCCVQERRKMFQVRE